MLIFFSLLNIVKCFLTYRKSSIISDEETSIYYIIVMTESDLVMQKEKSGFSNTDRHMDIICTCSAQCVQYVQYVQYVPALSFKLRNTAAAVWLGNRLNPSPDQIKSNQIQKAKP